MNWMRSLGLGLLVASSLAAGCGDDGGAGGGAATSSTGVFGRVLSTEGAAVAGATVTVAGRSTTTGNDGTFELSASAGEVVVRAEADGFVFSVQNATVVIGSPTAVDVILLREADPVTVSADSGGEALGDRGARVDLPAGALVDASGEPVVGDVQVYLTPLDPSDPDELVAAPGGLRAANASGDIVQLESFGMMDITIRQDDEELQLAAGMMMPISIPAPADVMDPPQSMPLWSFDEASGQWVEEGTLTYDADTDTYVGEISHMSFWNADQELETTCITGTVVDGSTGEVIAGARVRTSGLDYTGTSSTNTDDTGRFIALVRVDSDVSVAAYHQSGGGQIREVSSGSAVVGSSPTADQCTDVGEWRVTRGEVEFADGMVVGCDLLAFGSLEACLPTTVEIIRCFNPQGSCEYADGGSLFSPNIIYANGARLEQDFDTSGSVISEYYGPGGVYCGRQVIETSGTTLGAITVETAAGRTATYGADVQGAGSTITYTCETGGTVTITEAEQQAIAACNGSADQECSGDPTGGGGGGGLCDTSDECGAGAICCFGLCQTAEDSVCLGGGGACTSDTDCTDEFLCCDTEYEGETYSVCQSRFECFGTSNGCRDDSMCDDGETCCDGVCESRPFCEGECQTSADCADGGVCCPDDVYSYCTDDDNACYGGTVCETAADCGETGELVCCPGDEGSDATCSTQVDCYAFQDCSAGQVCQGSMTCCEENAFGAPVCLPGCAYTSTCTRDADCGGLTCCLFGAEGICLTDAECSI